MVVVTGAAGFIGSAFIWELNQHGFSNILAVESELGNGSKWKNLAKRSFSDYVPHDQLLDYLNQPEILKQIRHIFHIGACSTTTETNTDFLIENNYEYSKKLFLWCARNKVPFIYASSCATYGAGEMGFDDAMDPQKLVPLNGYGYSKVLFDRWALKQLLSPPVWAGLRYSNVYGPQEYHKGEQASVAHKAFHQIHETGRLKLFKSYRPDFKDGFQKRDFIYIKDVTAWMREMMVKPFKSGVYNMGYGRARSWMDLAQATFLAMEKPLNIDWIEMPESIRGQYQYFTEARMDRFWSQGFIQPKWTLEDGVRDYFKTYLTQHDSYL